MALDANPWLKQMMVDVEVLVVLDDGQILLDLLEGQPLLRFKDSAAHDAFIAFDLSQLRAWWLALDQPASEIICVSSDFRSKP